MKLSGRLRRVLQEALGVYDDGDKPYRNYLAVIERHTVCRALVDAGLMYRGASPTWTEATYYHVTADGMRAVGVDPSDIE